jgi:hypothetical protein
MQLSFPNSKWRLTYPRPQVCELFGTDRADERRKRGRDIDGGDGFLEEMAFGSAGKGVASPQVPP